MPSCHAVRILLRVQPRSGYYLCQLTFPCIYYVSPTVYLYFSTAVFFPFPSRLFLAYPQHHSSSPYYTQPPYLRFVSSFHSSMQCTNTYLDMCLTYASHICLGARPLPTSPTVFNAILRMFQIQVAPQPPGTAHYIPLLLVMSFLRNYYYEGRDRMTLTSCF